jgi:hypothetical protein
MRPYRDRQLVPPRKLTVAEQARKIATVERIRAEVARAMENARRKSLRVAYDRVDRSVEMYLRALSELERWRAQRRKITYHALDHLLLNLWGHRDVPSPASRTSESASRKAAQKAVRVQTKLLEDENLPVEVRASIEHTLTLARRAARADKYWEADVPKQPEKFLAACAAEWVLIVLRPDHQPDRPIKIASYKGKGKSTYRPETYAPMSASPPRSAGMNR